MNVGTIDSIKNISQEGHGNFSGANVACDNTIYDVKYLEKELSKDCLTSKCLGLNNIDDDDFDDGGVTRHNHTWFQHPVPFTSPCPFLDTEDNPLHQPQLCISTFDRSDQQSISSKHIASRLLAKRPSRNKTALLAWEKELSIQDAHYRKLGKEIFDKSLSNDEKMLIQRSFFLGLTKAYTSRKRKMSNVNYATKSKDCAERESIRTSTNNPKIKILERGFVNACEEFSNISKLIINLGGKDNGLENPMDVLVESLKEDVYF